MERIYFNILLFTANKLLAFAPKSIEVGKYAKYCTPEVQEFWELFGDKASA
jgi:hypothetical protein